jgi:hypothetical protein
MTLFKNSLSKLTLGKRNLCTRKAKMTAIFRWKILKGNIFYIIFSLFGLKLGCLN